MRRPFIFTSLGVVRGESKRGNRKCGPENSLFRCSSYVSYDRNLVDDKLSLPYIVIAIDLHIFWCPCDSTKGFYVRCLLFMRLVLWRILSGLSCL